MQMPESKSLVLREPIHPPAINPNLETLSVLPRSVECLRHFVLSTEYWLSPSGHLRWWLKINFGLAAFLIIPAVFLMPIIGLVLHEVDGWLTLLLSIVGKLILLGVLVTTLVFAIKHFSLSKGSPNTRHRKRRKPPFGGIAF